MLSVRSERGAGEDCLPTAASILFITVIKLIGTIWVVQVSLEESGKKAFL